MQKMKKKERKKALIIGYLIGGLLYPNYNPEKES